MKKSIILISLLVFSLMFVNVVSANSGHEEFQGDQLFVSVIEAEKTAKKFIIDSQFDPNWNESNIELSETFFDVDDSILGYYFTLNKYDSNVGYIVVAASKDRDPILRFGLGEIELEKSDGVRAYYLGSQIVYTDSIKDLIDNNTNIRTTDLSKFSVAKDIVENQTKWEYYLSDIDNIYITPFGPPYPTQKELNVTRIHQRATGVNSPDSACGPATGAMISNYYKSRGYNIRGTTYYGSDAKLVNHLYTEMNSGVFGTSYNDFASGLFTHLRHDGSTKWSGLGYQDSRSHFVEYKDAIYTDRPVALRYDFFTANPEKMKYHFVVGMAYNTVNGSNFFGIKDPDSGANNTSTNYYSWSSHSGDFAMHITMPQ